MIGAYTISRNDPPATKFHRIAQKFENECAKNGRSKCGAVGVEKKNNSN